MLVSPNEGILHHLYGLFFLADDPYGQPVDCGRITFDQQRERLGIARDDLPHDLYVGEVLHLPFRCCTRQKVTKKRASVSRPFPFFHFRLSYLRNFAFTLSVAFLSSSSGQQSVMRI